MIIFKTFRTFFEEKYYIHKFERLYNDFDGHILFLNLEPICLAKQSAFPSNAFSRITGSWTAYFELHLVHDYIFRGVFKTQSNIYEGSIL